MNEKIESLMRNSIYGFKVPPHKILNYKGKKNHFKVEKHGKHSSGQQWSSSEMGKTAISHHLTGSIEKNSLTSVVFPPQTYNPNLMMIKKINLKWNKNNWPVIFKSVKVMKVKDRMSNYSRKKLKKMSTKCNICYLKWISLL